MQKFYNQIVLNFKYLIKKKKFYEERVLYKILILQTTKL